MGKKAKDIEQKASNKQNLANLFLFCALCFAPWTEESGMNTLGWDEREGKEFTSWTYNYYYLEKMLCVWVALCVVSLSRRARLQMERNSKRGHVQMCTTNATIKRTNSTRTNKQCNFVSNVSLPPDGPVTQHSALSDFEIMITAYRASVCVFLCFFLCFFRF